jgi:putative ABC transport system substrate-binding protein
MKRRGFLALASGAAVWPLAAHAQQKAMPVIGFLGLGSASSHASRLSALRDGLQNLGYQEGRNIQIEFRWAEGDYSRLPLLADELVRLNIDIMLAHGAAGALAAQKATTTIPIVITAVGDMLALGLVSSLSRPSGNITGLSLFVAELSAKRLELTKEAVPGLRKAGILLNPDNASTQFVLRDVGETAKALNIVLRPFEARGPTDFERVFKAIDDEKIDAIVVHEDTMLTSNAKLIADLAAERRMPSSGFPEFARAGGLIAYGINFPDTDYRAATFVDKILKGAKPGDIPIERSTKFIVVINLRTAKALGLTVPQALLARADEVIE